MRTTFIEHVNLTVADPARSAGADDRGLRLAHPLARPGARRRRDDPRRRRALLHRLLSGRGPWRGPWAKGEPLNHVALGVEDLDAIERRVAAAGLRPFGHGDYAPGRRFYFLDHDGIEFEIVSYARVDEGAESRVSEASAV